MVTRRHRTRSEIGAFTGADHSATHFPAERRRDRAQTPRSRRQRPQPPEGAEDPFALIGGGLEQRILASALSSLAARSYSEEELRRRLLSRFAAPPEIDRCIALLKERGYVNDLKLAENYALHRARVKPIGRARLGREMSRKLVSKEVIESALTRAFQSLSEDDLIDRAIEKRIRSRGVPRSQADRKKMFDYLARLGFEYDLILRRLRTLGAESGLEASER